MIAEGREAHVLNQRLHYLVLVGHVRHHVGHVVVGGAHQSGAEHDGQVPRLHLPSKGNHLDFTLGMKENKGESPCVITLFFSEFSAMVFR